MAVVALKLSLVAATMLLATLAARRFGHAVGGALGGMPMVLAPILGVLLIDQPIVQVQAIALATLVCVPATVLFIVTYAWACIRWPWQACLPLALLAFLLAAWVLSAVRWPAAWVLVQAAVVPGLGLLVMPRRALRTSPVAIGSGELAWRIVAAVGMAAAVMASAETFPAMVSGLLLAVPIAGTILPTFTLPRYGWPATVTLLRGFASGLHGFVAFLVVLHAALAVLPPGAAFVIALGASAAAAWSVYMLRRRSDARASVGQESARK